MLGVALYRWVKQRSLPGFALTVDAGGLNGMVDNWSNHLSVDMQERSMIKCLLGTCWSLKILRSTYGREETSDVRYCNFLSAYHWKRHEVRTSICVVQFLLRQFILSEGMSWVWIKSTLNCGKNKGILSSWHITTPTKCQDVVHAKRIWPLYSYQYRTLIWLVTGVRQHNRYRTKMGGHFFVNA